MRYTTINTSDLCDGKQARAIDAEDAHNRANARDPGPVTSCAPPRCAALSELPHVQRAA